MACVVVIILIQVTSTRTIDTAQHPHERTVTSLTHSRLVEHVGCWWEDALE